MRSDVSVHIEMLMLYVQNGTLADVVAYNFSVRPSDNGKTKVCCRNAAFHRSISIIDSTSSRCVGFVLKHNHTTTFSAL